MSITCNFKRLLISVMLASASLVMAHESSETSPSSYLVEDIEEIKSIINDRIDEQAVKFLTDENISDKKKKQCLKKLKGMLYSTKRVSVKNDTVINLDSEENE